MTMPPRVVWGQVQRMHAYRSPRSRSPCLNRVCVTQVESLNRLKSDGRRHDRGLRPDATVMAAHSGHESEAGCMGRRKEAYTGAVCLQHPGRRALRLALGAAVTLGCLIDIGDGRRTTLTVAGDRRPGFLVEPFCFAAGGMLELHVRNFRLTDERTEELVKPKKVGIIIHRVDGATRPFAVTGAADGAGISCLITNQKPGDDVVLFRGANASFSQPITDAKAGLYSVVYANCDAGTAASFSLTTTLSNAGGVWLSAGDIPLPWIHGVASILFLASFCVWVRTLAANPKPTHKIHYLMGALCMVRAAVAGFEAMRYQKIKDTGDGYAWATLYYMLTFVKGVMLFSVILLIGTGWSFLRPYLQDRDKKILLVVVPLQVLVNTAMVVVEETPPGTDGWMTWRDILHLLDVLCCCAILFPIVWSIRHLREAAEADGKALRTLEKLRLFRQFYILVVCYIYFTRIIVYLVRVMLPCHMAWLARGASELASLAFYLCVGYYFR